MCRLKPGGGSSKKSDMTPVSGCLCLLGEAVATCPGTALAESGMGVGGVWAGDLPSWVFRGGGGYSGGVVPGLGLGRS